VWRCCCLNWQNQSTLRKLASKGEKVGMSLLKRLQHMDKLLTRLDIRAKRLLSVHNADISEGKCLGGCAAAAARRGGDCTHARGEPDQERDQLVANVLLKGERSRHM
jgi:hypothetical protein